MNTPPQKIIFGMIALVPMVFFLVAERRSEGTYDLIIAPRIGGAGSFVFESSYGTIDFQTLGHAHSKSIHWMKLPTNDPITSQYKKSFFQGMKSPSFSLQWATLTALSAGVALAFFAWYFALIIKAKFGESETANPQEKAGRHEIEQDAAP